MTAAQALYAAATAVQGLWLAHACKLPPKNAFTLQALDIALRSVNKVDMAAARQYTEDHGHDTLTPAFWQAMHTFFSQMEGALSAISAVHSAQAPCLRVRCRASDAAQTLHAVTL